MVDNLHFAQTQFPSTPGPASVAGQSAGPGLFSDVDTLRLDL